MGTVDMCRVLKAAVSHGSARQTSGTGPCGDCRRALWVPGPRGQYSGEIRLIEKPGVQDVAKKLLLTHGRPTPKSNFRDGT